jgi:hypothetical protein
VGGTPSQRNVLVHVTEPHLKHALFAGISNERPLEGDIIKEKPDIFSESFKQQENDYDCRFLNSSFRFCVAVRRFKRGVVIFATVPSAIVLSVVDHSPLTRGAAGGLAFLGLLGGSGRVPKNEKMSQ